MRIDLRQLIAGGDSDALTFAVSDPADGELIDDGGGSWTYLAGTRFTGSDSFRYAVGDGSAATSATVRLTLAPKPAVAQPPDARAGSVGGKPQVDADARQTQPLASKPAPGLLAALADYRRDAPGLSLTAGQQSAGKAPDAVARETARLPSRAPETAGAAARRGNLDALPSASPENAASAAAAPRVDWRASPRLSFAAPHRAPAPWLREFFGTRPNTSIIADRAALTIPIDA